MTRPDPTSPAAPAAPGARRGSAWRGALAFLPLIVWTLGAAFLLAVVALLVPPFRRHGFVRWVHVWGRVPLALCGVRLEVHGAEHVAGPGPRLILFNHVSLLDLYLLAALCPERPLVLYKKEFERVPGIGLALRVLGMIPVDRSDREAALRSVAEAGRRIGAERANCMIAPEGTRSRAGGLQEFKLGAFHLAARHGLPVVPMIMRGIEAVLPMGSLLIRGGTVRVDYLAPVDTSDWSPDSVRRHAGEVRARFLELLPAAADAQGAA